MPKLSIIVPVYNVEPYIRPCLESISKQGLDENDYEVIIVNDGSTDKSMEMIADMICQHNNITIINQENQGLSVARNNGIDVAKGEYILMPDSDDLLIENSLKPLLEIAIESQADLIVADFLKMTDKQICNLHNIKQNELNVQEKTGEQLYLEDLNPHECFVWRTLYRRDFIHENELKFIPGVYCQDIPFTHEAYIKAKKCIRTHWILNIYRKARPGSASLSFGKKKALDFCLMIAKTWELRRSYNLNSKIKQKLQNNIYISFRYFVYYVLFTIKSNKYRTFLLKQLKEKAPDIYFPNGLNQQIHSIIFRYFPHLYFYFLKIILFVRKKNHY